MMLKTKLHKPEANENLIYRSELFEKLNKGQNKKLILVSAPAGYGKTTVITQWLDQNKNSFSWYSLDNSDNDLAIFLRYLIAGIQTKHKSFGLKALSLIESSNALSIETIATFLINDILELKENIFIVLDDFHLITNKEIIDFLGFMLENLPANTHYILITRSDPTLPFARLRSQQQLSDIRLSDLSFNANNIYDFFKKNLKINLTVEDAKTLETKTEGWIAGLQLTGLSLQGKEDITGFVNTLKGDNRYIMDYLIEEVLQLQLPEIKDFLLFTSILKRFTASLCNSLLNISNSQQIIEQLERNNMFLIPLDSERKWYRYHHLFEQLLLNRLSSVNHELANLHRKASLWYEEQEMIEDAIEHSLKIKDYKRGLELLNKISSKLWEEGKHTSLLNYGKLLPDEEIYTNAEFSLYYSWTLIHTGQAEKSTVYIENTEKILKKSLSQTNSNNGPDFNEKQELLGKVSVALAFKDFMFAKIDRIDELVKNAFQYLDKNEPLWHSWAWYALGTKEMMVNNYEGAIKAFEVALKFGKQAGNIPQISTTGMRLSFCEQRLGKYKACYKHSKELLAYINNQGLGEITKIDWTFAGLYTSLGIIEFMWADLDKAYKHQKLAYDLSNKEPNITTKFSVIIVYAIILQGVGRKEESQEKLKEVEALLANKTVPPHIAIIYVAWKGYLLVKEGNTEETEMFFSENNIEEHIEINYLNEHGFIPYSYFLISQSKFELAENTLTKIQDLAIKANRTERLIEINILYAYYYQEIKKINKAIDSIIEAMKLASEEDFVYTIIYYYGPVGNLIREACKICKTKDSTVPISFIKKLESGLDKFEKLNAVKNQDELSSRELDTLKLIAENLTNQEIAERLFISVQTVKSHVKNILLKLNVDSRYKAAQKAKENGLA